MPAPVGEAVVEIRSFTLAKDDPGDKLLEPGPLVDQFGQWIPATWPGKAASLDDLQRAWAEEAKALQPGGYDYCKYGGYKSTHAKATGFFRVEQIDGKWWFVDPDGHLFLSVGSDCIRAGIETSTRDREGVFAALPPAGSEPHAAVAPGRAFVSFYTWNLQRRFGDDWQPKWIDFYPAAAGGVGLQHDRQLVGPGLVCRPAHALRRAAGGLGYGAVHGHARRLLARMAEESGRGRPPHARRARTIRGCWATSSPTSRPGRAASRWWRT